MTGDDNHSMILGANMVYRRKKRKGEYIGDKAGHPVYQVSILG